MYPARDVTCPAPDGSTRQERPVRAPVLRHAEDDGSAADMPAVAVGDGSSVYSPVIAMGDGSASYSSVILSATKDLRTEDARRSFATLSMTPMGLRQSR